jgi:hypothetical protein
MHITSRCTSHRTNADNGYGEMATRMVELAAQQPGYLECTADSLEREIETREPQWHADK